MVYLPPYTGGLLNKGSTELGSYEKTTQKAIYALIDQSLHIILGRW